MVLNILREADRPVCFSVVGTTEHIAAAIRLEPELFTQKCAGIYLAAGTGVESAGGILEYNVRLHPSAFVTTLSAPCPVYWAPCYHTILPGEGGMEKGGEYGSVYCIQQKELLDTLSGVMQKYFLYMLTRSEDPKYLRYLEKPVDTEALAFFGEQERRLWSTPLLLTLAGLEGESYEFLPVQVECTTDGHVSWTPSDSENIENCRYIFHIKNCDRQTDNSFDSTGTYKEELLTLLKQLLGQM
jgi:hypothetical protein